MLVLGIGGWGKKKLSAQRETDGERGTEREKRILMTVRRDGESCP